MFKFLINIFTSKKSKDDFMKKFLIVGLGNIGTEYSDTRHNIGFKIVDKLAEKKAVSFETGKLGSITSFNHKGRKLILLKPSTFMNLSGKAVNYWMQKEKISTENLLIITDDLNLDFGSIRLKAKGTDGGHNGLKDIQKVLNTTKYPRFRFGIGDTFSKGKQVNFVLGKWSDEEQEKLKERLETASNLVLSFVTAGIANTMNQFNGK